jgi:hypothetical protein
VASRPRRGACGAELDGTLLAWIRDPDEQVLSIFQPV